MKTKNDIGTVVEGLGHCGDGQVYQNQSHKHL